MDHTKEMRENICSNNSSLCCYSSTSDDEFEIVDYRKIEDKVCPTKESSEDESITECHQSSISSPRETGIYSTIISDGNSIDFISHLREDKVKQTSTQNEASLAKGDKEVLQRQTRELVNTIVNDTLLFSIEKQGGQPEITRTIPAQTELPSIHQSFESMQEETNKLMKEAHQQLTAMNNTIDNLLSGEETASSKMQNIYLKFKKTVRDIFEDVCWDYRTVKYLFHSSLFENEKNDKGEQLKDLKDEETDEFFQKLATFYFPYTILSSYLFFLSVVGKTEIVTYTLLREAQTPVRNIKRISSQFFTNTLGRVILVFSALLYVYSIYIYHSNYFLQTPILSDKDARILKPEFESLPTKVLYPQTCPGRHVKSSAIPFYIEQNNNPATGETRVPQVVSNSRKSRKIPSVIPPPEAEDGHGGEPMKWQMKGNRRYENKDTAQRENRSHWNNKREISFLLDILSDNLEDEIEIDIEDSCYESCMNAVEEDKDDLETLFIDEDNIHDKYTKPLVFEADIETEAFLFCEMLCDEITDSFQDYLEEKLPEVISNVYSEYRDEFC